MIYLIVFIFFSMVALSVTPARFFFHCAGWVFLLTCGYVLVQALKLDLSPLGMPDIRVRVWPLLLIIFLPFLVIRFLLRAEKVLMSRRTAESFTPSPAQKISAHLLWAFCGFLMTALALSHRSVTQWLTPEDINGTLISISLLLSVLSLLLLAVRAAKIHSYIPAGLIGIACGCLVMAVDNSRHTDLVRRSMAEVAKHAPYCVAIKNEKPLMILADLGAFSVRAVDHMPGNKSFYSLNQIYLYVRHSPYSISAYQWDYPSRAFKPLKHPNKEAAMQLSSAPCEPEANFINLFLPRPKKDYMTFVTAQEAYRVPLSYRPHHDQYSGISFHASTPDYLPVPPQSTTGSYLRVTNIGAQGLEKVSRIDKNETPFAKDDQYGLQKTLFTPENKKLPSNIDYSFIGADGTRTTYIRCPQTERFTSPCRHSFIAGALLYNVSYPVSLLPQWREIQDNFVTLVEGWRIKDGTANAVEHKP